MSSRKAMCHAAAAAVVTMFCAQSAVAASPDDAKGLWMTAAKDAVLDLRSCSGKPGSLCGRIVWDKDAGGPSDTCGVRIVQLNNFDGSAWRDGWVFDPRDKKNYKGKITASGSTLTIRAFLGVEVLGQSESFSRVSALPASPVCKK